MSYCDYETDSGESDAFCPLSMNLMCSKITPATKEQRDTLMKAMSDAGWEFDFEKKELKKISQRMISAEAKEAMYSNSAWSEEDESYLNTTIAYLKDAKEFKKTAENCITWLKSLKERCTWKPNEEQLKAIKWIMDGDNPENWTITLTNLYNDLKKLSQS
jgi:hypothetical protein